MEWAPRPSTYNALKAGSIDGTDVVPHDHAVLRAMSSKYTPPSNPNSVPEKTLFIGRLSQTVSEEEVHEVFQKYGRIRSFRFVRDIVTGFPRGYAFVEFERTSSAEEAYRRANRKIIHGKEIVVEFEAARTMPGWIPRRLGGGFGGRKESGQLRFGGRDRPFKKPIEEILKDREGGRHPLMTNSHINREKPEKRYEPFQYPSRGFLYSAKTRCTRSQSRSHKIEYKKDKHLRMLKDRSRSRSHRRRSRSDSFEKSDNEKFKMRKYSLKSSQSRSRDREREVKKSDSEESEIRHRSKKKKYKKEKRPKKKKRASNSPSPFGSKKSAIKDHKKNKSDRS